MPLALKRSWLSGWRSLPVYVFALYVVGYAHLHLTRSTLDPAWLLLVELVVAFLPAQSLRVYGRGRHHGLAVTSIILFALFVRLYQIELYPPQIHNDAASCGLDILAFANGTMKLGGLGFGGIPVFAYATYAPAIWLGYDPFLTVRTMNAIFGTLSIVFVYGFTKEMLGARTALCAAFFLATAPWHIHFSRTAGVYIQGTFFTTLGLWLMARVVGRGGFLNYAWASIGLSMCFATYHASRFTIVIAALMALRRPWAFMALVVPISVVGYITYFYDMQNLHYWERARQVFVLSETWNEGAYRHAMNQGETVVGAIWVQLRNALLAFNGYGDRSMQYGNLGAIMTVVAGPLAVIGVGRAFRTGAWTVLFWFFVPLGIVAMTVDSLFLPRFVASMPVASIFAAMGLVAVVGYMPAWLARGLIIGVFATQVFYAYAHVLDHDTVQQRADYNATGSRLARQQSAAGYNVYVITGPQYLLHALHQTFRFLAPRTEIYGGTMRAPWTLMGMSGDDDAKQIMLQNGCKTIDSGGVVSWCSQG